MIKVSRVEVLGDNVQKYSSTSVSGGGGYVTSSNGNTYGQTHAIESTVSHHVDQDIWVRDLSDGKETQLNLKGGSFPVRAGHILTIAYDELSKSWERLVNETTSATSNGNGFFNQKTVDRYYQEYMYATLWAIGLTIPILNFLIGLILLKIIFFGIPSNVKGEHIPGSAKNILISFVSGCVLLIASFITLFNFTIWDYNFLVKAIAIAANLCIFFIFRKSYGENFLKASLLVSKRAALLEQTVTQFRKNIS